MLLTETERELKINEFLDRKLKEFSMEDDEPLSRAVRPFKAHITNARA